MEENIIYRNTRTGEISKCVKVMQSSWDKESDPDKIKDFFVFMLPGMRDMENGDIIESYPLPHKEQL